MTDDFEKYFGKKFNTEQELINRGWEFESEKHDTHITYKNGLLFRIYYDGNLIDENGFIDEISIFDNHGSLLFNGHHPKDSKELDELLLKFSF